MLRKILLPIVPVYHGVTWLRNYFYDKQIFKSKSYDFPVICVGNLSVGGTGKTPMIEYIIRLLKGDYLVGTLSRGYGRTTKGFVNANNNATAKSIGDEPFQFYNKFSDIIVSVGEDRQNAIKKLLLLNESPNVLLLDDAFQHRKVSAGLNILLTSYNNIYVNDMALPTGNLREPKSGAKRADIIVITKCPKNISEREQRKIVDELKVEHHQKVFFSSIVYSNVIYSKENQIDLNALKDKKFTLVTGIANPKPLVNYLKKNEFDFNHDAFDDHHNFSDSEINELKKKDVILTTEKDYVRLKDNLDSDNLYYLPIELEVLNEKAFNTCIESFVKNYT